MNEVFADNCIVHWRPPQDDGGSDIIDYIVEAVDLTESCSTWIDIGHTQSLKFKALNLEEGHCYKFRVRAVNSLGKSEPCVMNGNGVVMKNPWDVPSPPGRPITIDWCPFSCDLAWTPSAWDGGADITHYDVEMREKTLGIWQLSISISCENLTYLADGKLSSTCPGLCEGLTYTFRVRAVNKGGRSLPSPQSEPEIVAKNRAGKNNAFLLSQKCA